MGREIRARDIVAGRVPPQAQDGSPHDQDEGALDAATIAQLAAWFGAPAPPEPPPAEDPEIRKVRERRERALEAVDPAFLARFEAKAGQADALIHLPEPMTLAIERIPLARLDLSVWNLSVSDEVREHERPDEITEALHEPTPQAILRDLHRPEMYWQITLQPQPLGVDSAGERARMRVKETIATRYAVHADAMPIASHVAARAFTELRTRLDVESWEASYIPPEQRRDKGSALPSAEDLKWFGLIGYDPDL